MDKNEDYTGLKIRQCGAGKGYLIIGEFVDPTDEMADELLKLVEEGEALIHIPENTLLDFLCSDLAGSDVLKKVNEKKKA